MDRYVVHHMAKCICVWIGIPLALESLLEADYDLTV